MEELVEVLPSPSEFQDILQALGADPVTGRGGLVEASMITERFIWGWG
jgi:hypothetical protein